MLVHTIKKYLPTRCGIIVLETPDNGYIYTDAKIFQSAVMLSSQAFYQTFESAESIVKPKDVAHRETIKRLYEFLPYPLKPLSLLLYWTEQEYDVLSDQLGCLHVISTIVHPYYWLKAPKEQRTPLGPFGPSIRTEFTYDWKAFIDGCIDYEKIINPSESGEKHPIFVINAISGQLPFESQSPLAAPPSGGYAIEIDLDDILGDEDEVDNEDEDIKIEKLTVDTRDKVNTNYSKLLE